VASLLDATNRAVTDQDAMLLAVISGNSVKRVLKLAVSASDRIDRWMRASGKPPDRRHFTVSTSVSTRVTSGVSCRRKSADRLIAHHDRTDDETA